MKRRPPGYKARQKAKLPPPAVSASFSVGDEARDALQALLARMERNPSSFVFFDDDGILDYLNQDQDDSD